MNFKERIINALYGQSVADAVGNPFEFKETIDPDSVIEYANASSVLTISDDTQMTLFGFEALNRLFEHRKPSYRTILSYFSVSYTDWYYTQNADRSVSLLYYLDSGLVSFASMYSIQAPGLTCLNSLETILDDEIVVNDSMGCGSVMRLLPLVSLFDGTNLETVIEYAKITGNITHKHAANAQAIEDYIRAACDIIQGISVANPFPLVVKIEELGKGWIAPECVNMAIWCYHTANTFDDLLRLSVSHCGDSDSVAAVAGSLWGLSGREVPQKYINKLDALDSIKYTINKME